MNRTRLRLSAGAASTMLVLAASLASGPVAASEPAPALPSDFNGDGYVDLAVGVPREEVGTQKDAGAVNVLYGSRSGLSAAGNQRWTQASRGVKGVVGRDWFGAALASADFDRDGYADLAIGAPGDDGGGAVNVLYGSGAGLMDGGDQRWTGADVAGMPSRQFGFGDALAAGDFNGDGYGDIAIGGTADLGGPGYSGVIAVLYGGADGLAAAGAALLDQSTLLGVSDAQQEIFGSALAAGDLDGNGADDLAMATSVSAASGWQRGSVGVAYGSPAGLPTSGGETWTQDSDGVPGVAEDGDGFGASLAVGDFDGDGVGDLVVGVPGEEAGTAANAGAVNVLYGSPVGLTSDGSQLWSQASPGVKGAAAEGDRLGRALATGDFNSDGAGDLAIGAPNDNPGGIVVVLYGRSRVGLTATGSQQWSQDSVGVPGHRERPDRFGLALAAGNYGRSSRDDLVIGVPHERLAGTRHAGMVNVLYGRSDGLDGAHAQGWSQGSPGVRGSLELADWFGDALTP